MESRALHEINRYRDAAFPVELYRVSHAGMEPTGRGLRDYHWHEELQLTLVTSGRATVQVQAAAYELVAGEALYIGGGRIHAVTALSPDGAYVSLDFPARLLGFFPGSRMEQRDVLPHAARWPELVLRPSVPWQAEALDQLRTIERLFRAPGAAGADAGDAELDLRALWGEDLARGHRRRGARERGGVLPDVPGVSADDAAPVPAQPPDPEGAGAAGDRPQRGGDGAAVRLRPGEPVHPGVQGGGRLHPPAVCAAGRGRAR